VAAVVESSSLLHASSFLLHAMYKYFCQTGIMQLQLYSAWCFLICSSLIKTPELDSLLRGSLKEN